MAWIGAVAGIAGALISSNSNDNAADTQAGATQSAIDEQRRQFDLIRGDTQPYRETGIEALRRLYGEIDKPLDPNEVMNDPGYQFGLQQGMQALDRRRAAAGGRISGAAIREGARYTTGAATAGYGAAYQRRQDRLNRLAALAGIGQTSTNTSAAAGMQTGTNVSNLLSAQGNAAAASQLAQGNIWANTTNQLAALYGRNNSNQSSGWGTSGLNDFYFGNGTSGD